MYLGRMRAPHDSGLHMARGTHARQVRARVGPPSCHQTVGAAHRPTRVIARVTVDPARNAMQMGSAWLPRGTGRSLEAIKARYCAVARTLLRSPRRV